MAVKYGRIRTAGVLLLPKDPAEALPGELYRDQNNADSLTDQSTGGTDTQVGAASSDSLFVKYKYNASLSIIPAGTIVALTSTGNILPADSDGVGLQYALGISKVDIDPNSYGPVNLRAANISGILSGLNIAPGKVIYLNNTGANRGFTDDISGLDPMTNSIVKMGYSDLASNTNSGFATDLILIGEDMSRPL